MKSKRLSLVLVSSMGAGLVLVAAPAVTSPAAASPTLSVQRWSWSWWPWSRRTSTPRPTASTSPTVRPTAQPLPYPTGGVPGTVVPSLTLTFPAGTPSVRPTATGAPPQVTGGASGSVVGWASQNGGTSGGAGGTVVEVSDAAGFLAAVQSSTSQTVRVRGSIALSGMNKVASDKTIVGSGSASITGGGLNLSGVRNVVIRNIAFSGWDDDAINVQNSSTNVWIDHNSFSDGYDGAVDIKRGSDFVTVSWNRFFDHDKTCLLGHSDDNAAEDTGRLRVTYHHNWFDGTKQRHPRVRFGNPVHVFNNYYAGTGGYGVASTEGAGVLVESNYFEDVEDPFHLGEGDSGPGTLVARGNHLVNSGAGQAGGSVAAIPYAYTADPAASVKSLVTAGAGAGKL